MGQTALSKLEKGGVVDPTSKTLQALAKILGLEYREVVAMLVDEKYGEKFSVEKNTPRVSPRSNESEIALAA